MHWQIVVVLCGLKDSEGRSTKKYIPKDNESLAATLAQKAYLKEQLRCDKKQLKALEKFMRDYERGSIANLLYQLHIPFLYEPIIVINGIEYAPDFIIMIPSTGMLYMWEHFGMMDNPDYVRKNLGKIELYAQKGWILGQNLILTTETYDSPFNVEKAEYALRQVVPFLDKESA